MYKEYSSSPIAGKEDFLLRSEPRLMGKIVESVATMFRLGHRVLTGRSTVLRYRVA